MMMVLVPVGSVMVMFMGVGLGWRLLHLHRSSVVGFILMLLYLLKVPLKCRLPGTNL